MDEKRVQTTSVHFHKYYRTVLRGLSTSRRGGHPRCFPCQTTNNNGNKCWKYRWRAPCSRNLPISYFLPFFHYHGFQSGKERVLVNSGSWINELRAIGKTTFARLFIGIDRGEIVSRSGRHGDGDRYRAKTLQLLSSIRRSSATNYFSGSGFLLMTS